MVLIGRWLVQKRLDIKPRIFTKNPHLPKVFAGFIIFWNNILTLVCCCGTVKNGSEKTGSDEGGENGIVSLDLAWFGFVLYERQEKWI